MQSLSTDIIYEPVKNDLARVDKILKDVAQIDFPFLVDLLDHIIETGGKRVRPAVTILASSFHPHETRAIEIMGAAVELLHIATLVHDDTIDDSNLRRGKATISSLWGRNIAVLVGDYIFASSARHVCDTGNVKVIKRFSETIMELSSGELQEISEAYSPNQSMKTYLERIYKKTGSLFTTAGESGAILSGASESFCQALKLYGYNIGMAFQIVDDILDLDGDQLEIGKPIGNDLAHGIITLPAILLIEKYPQDNPVIKLMEDSQNAQYLDQSVDMIRNSSIIRDSYSVAESYCNNALNQLKVLPDSSYRKSLESLVEYVVKRRN